MNLSVRSRLTIVVAVAVGAVAAFAAIVAPNIVESILIDDILDADAEFQSVVFDSDMGFSDFGPFFDSFLESMVDDPFFDVVEDPGAFADFIDLGGTDELVVSLGGDAFLVVQEDGSQQLVRTDIGEISQPVISLSAFPEFAFGDLPDMFDDALPFLGGSSSNGRTVSGVRTVDGVEFIVVGDASSVDRTVSRVQRGLWLAVPVLMLTAGLIAWLLASRALRPVRLITDQAATISGGSLDTRVPVPATGDEIANLATTVNEMLGRLEADDRRRRAFVSDASHELRSPVAVLRSEAEVALRHQDETDVEELATGVLSEATRMATMIDDLLALARHDEGLPAPSTEVDLDDIVLEEATRNRGVEVDTSGVSAGRVLGRPDELSRMVAHLLDNAARHTASQCRVSLQTTGEGVTLAVDDDGPGIPSDMRDVVFERFTRLDEARSRDRGGAGLGLAVVAGIAERSGGSVSITDSSLGGARFVVTFPTN